MKNKIISLFVVALFVLAFQASFVSVTNAQTVSFPAGCGASFGFSATTGRPCSGTDVATIGPLPGCTTPLGYSNTNGVPCSGTSVAIFYLAGCSSTLGYSAESGKQCDGTVGSLGDTAYVPPTTPTTPPTIIYPGLPTTGQGGNKTVNTILLASSGLVALLGLSYIVRKKMYTA